MVPSLGDYRVADQLPNIVAVLGTVIIVITCVLFHYEGLRALSLWVTMDLLPARARIATLIFGLLVLHVIEIWIFALGYYLLSRDPAFGVFHQAPYETTDVLLAMTFFDQVYYSAVVYTTLGFGDIIPGGPMRFLTGVEALSGLVLITWSASFMFLEMQRYWGRD